jgi:hypothetical protein
VGIGGRGVQTKGRRVLDATVTNLKALTGKLFIDISRGWRSIF